MSVIELTLFCLLLNCARKTMSDQYDLSFLKLTRGPLQPTILDTEAYLPGRGFWYYTLLEPYTIGKAAKAELQEEGWEELEPKNPIIHQLASRLCLVLAVKTRGSKKRNVTLWARTHDIAHAHRYPVVLVHESSNRAADTPSRTLGTIGSHALVFEDEHVHCYDLLHLGERGQTQWKLLGNGLMPMGQTGQTLEETIRFQSIAFVQAQEAALQLTELYWQLHERERGHSRRLIPQAPIALKHGGIVVPRLDPIEGVLLALSHAQIEEGGWEEMNTVPVYVHERPTSRTEVSVRPQDIQVDVVGVDITKQLWQRVRQFNDVDGDIFLAMLAQVLTTSPEESGDTWIHSHQILEYRGIEPKNNKRHTKSGDIVYRHAGHRREDLQEIAEGVERIRNTHITIYTWKARDQGKNRTSRRARRPEYGRESYLFTISDFLWQSQLFSEEGQDKRADLQIAWRYRPGTCLDALLGGPNYKAAWLLQQALHYDPYHELWEKRLARYFTFQLRMNADFGGSIIKRTIGALVDELALPLNHDDPKKTRQRFEKAMHQLVADSIISGWGPEKHYQDALLQLPRYNWLSSWLAKEIEISADPLPKDQIQAVWEHQAHRRRRRNALFGEEK